VYFYLNLNVIIVLKCFWLLIYHFEQVKLEELKINMTEVYQKCQEKLNSFSRKKKLSPFFKRTELFSRLNFSSAIYS